MDPEMVNSVINNLADKLAVPAGKLIEILPRIGYRSVCLTLTQFAGSILLFILFLIFNYMRKKEKTSDGFQMFTVLTFTTLFLSLFVFVICILNVSGCFFWLHDPEAWALNYILNNF